MNMVEGDPRAPRRARLKLRERIAFLEARRDDLQAAGNRLLLRAREAEAACVLASRAVRAMREDITAIGEAVRLRVSEQEARIAELEAENNRLKKLDTYEIGYQDGESSKQVDLVLFLDGFDTLDAAKAAAASFPAPSSEQDEPSKCRAECCGELAEGPCEDCPFVPIVAVGMPHIEGDGP